MVVWDEATTFTLIVNVAEVKELASREGGG